MSTITVRRSSASQTRARPPMARPAGRDWSFPMAAAAAAALCVAVTAIHVRDQGGLLGWKTPAYVGLGYYLLEAAGVVVAGALVVHAKRAWWLAAGVAAAPLLGYVLSRGPGLPNYLDDRGNWTEPLGLISLAVEGALLLLALAILARSKTRSA